MGFAGFGDPLEHCILAVSDVYASRKFSDSRFVWVVPLEEADWAIAGFEMSEDCPERACRCLG